MQRFLNAVQHGGLLLVAALVAASACVAPVPRGAPSPSPSVAADVGPATSATERPSPQPSPTADAAAPGAPDCLLPQIATRTQRLPLSSVQVQLDAPKVIARNDNAKFQLTLTNRDDQVILLGGDGDVSHDLFHLEIINKQCKVLHYSFKRSIASLAVLVTLKPHEKTVLTASWTPANSSDNNVYPGTHWAIGRVGAMVMPNGSATTNKDVLWDWKEILVVP